jgi:ubiquinone/menaquinone biosynthesis C-methylase UbiE
VADINPDAVPLIDVGRFDELDRSHRAGDFVRWMEHQRRAGADRALDLLALGHDERVLEIGSGTGVDLAALADQAGHAVGVDRSLNMAETGKARIEGRGASVAVADGHDLPFAAGTFDACWARAVLVHTEDPQQVVAELARVLRPGGRVVLSEPDHGSHIVSTSELDVFERIKAHRRNRFRNPLVGRRLGDLVTQAGLAITANWVTPLLHRSLAAARASGGPFDVAVQAAVDDGAITAEEGDRYLASLTELDARGAFVFAALAVSTAAVSPAVP